MNLRFLHLHKWNHDNFINDFILKNNLYKLSSVKLDNRIFDFNFYYGNSLTKNLHQQGYTTKDIVVDNHLSNENWFSENFHNKNYSYEEKLLKRIIDFDPHIIFFQDISTLSQKLLLNLSEKLKNLKLKIVSVGFPVDNHKVYELYDLIIFRYPELYDEMKNKTKNSVMLYHSFNNFIYDKFKLKEFNLRNNLVNFSGSATGINHNNHKKRYYYLNKILQNKKINVSLSENINKDQMKRYYISKIYRLIPKIFRKFFINICDNKKITNKLNNFFSRLKNFNNNFDNDKYFYHGPLTKIHNLKSELIYGNNLFSKILNTKISLNIHTEKLKNNVANVRMFEITGCGSCMFVENRVNIEDLFDKKKEVVTYDNIEDLIDKITFYSNNLEITEKIAFNGYEKTRKLHTTKNRAIEIDKIVKKLI